MINLLLIRFAGVAAAIAIGWMAVSWFASHHHDTGYKEAQEEYAAKLAEAKQVALESERSMSKKLQDAQNARAKTEIRLNDARRAVADADNRLRNATDYIRNSMPTATAETARATASTAVELLGQCSRQYSEVASAADGHAADSQQCHSAWPE
jgi:isoleucyl-tRNA synthetase